MFNSMVALAALGVAVTVWLAMVTLSALLRRSRASSSQKADPGENTGPTLRPAIELTCRRCRARVSLESHVCDACRKHLIATRRPHRSEEVKEALLLWQEISANHWSQREAKAHLAGSSTYSGLVERYSNVAMNCARLGQAEDAQVIARLAGFFQRESRWGIRNERARLVLEDPGTFVDERFIKRVETARAKHALEVQGAVGRRRRTLTRGERVALMLGLSSDEGEALVQRIDYLAGRELAIEVLVAAVSYNTKANSAEDIVSRVWTAQKASRAGTPKAVVYSSRFESNRRRH